MNKRVSSTRSDQENSRSSILELREIPRKMTPEEEIAYWKKRALRAEAAKQEAEIRAEEKTEEAEQTIQQARFWLRAFWWMGNLFHAAEQQLERLKEKVLHTDALLGNAKLKPEQRTYLYAAQEMQRTRKVDPEGRVYLNSDKLQARAGLSKTTMYRVRKELKSAGILDTKTYTRQTAQGVRSDHFEKLNPQVYERPADLDAQAPRNGGYHPPCNSCEAEDTIVSRKTVQTVTCRECGNVSTTISPAIVTLNPKYHQRASKTTPAQENLQSSILELRGNGEVDSA